MKFNLRPGIVIYVFGFCGLVFSLAHDGGFISKIPLAFFSIIIILIGVAIEVMPKRFVDDSFGERDVA